MRVHVGAPQLAPRGRGVGVVLAVPMAALLITIGPVVGFASASSALCPPPPLQSQRTPAEPKPPKKPPKAKEPEKKDDKQADDKGLKVFARHNDLAELLDALSALLGVGVEFNRSEVSGAVSMPVPPPNTLEALLDVVSRALVAKGFTTVQMPGSAALTVVKLADAPSLARLESRSLQQADAGFVKVLIELGHERTESVAEAVKLVLSKSGQIATFKDTRSILVSDLKPNVEQAMKVVARLDGDSVDMDVLEMRLEHADPVALVALLERIGTTRKAVFGEKPAGTVIARPEGRSVLVIAPTIEQDVWRDLVARFDKVEPTTTMNYFPGRFGVRETAGLIEQVVPVGSDRQGWRLVSDELTGTLVVTATPSQHHLIEDLFTRLESTDEGPRRPIRSFPIKNRGVEELKDLLQAMLDKGALKGLPEVQKAPTGEVVDHVPPKNAEGVTGPIPGTAPPAGLATKELGDEVILAADKDTNRLIAMGNARVLEQLGKLIEELDVRHPQVLVEALVVTLTDSQALDLGVEMQKQGTSGDMIYRLSSLFGLGSPNPAASTLPAAGGTGFSGVTLDPGSFSAVVKALETVNKGRSRTIPKVLVNNNQKAELNSVLQTPFASTNASTTVATTSFGGTLDAGTQISVTPQITEGEQLLLDYTISISSFTGSASNPNLPPPRQENRLRSVVSVPDGYTVVVGGLEVETKTKDVSEVPLLGRVPILGPLFQSSSRSESKSRFFVFLRCSVLRANGFEDLRYASGKDMVAAKVDDGWPTLEPRVIR